MKALSYLALSLCVLATPSFAQTTLDRIFTKTYHDPQVYVEGRCRENIERLTQLAIQAGVNPNTLTTIEMMPLGDLWVNKARNYKNKIVPYGRRAFFYHVVLFDGKKVYDYDYLDRPTPISIKDYFNDMMMRDDYRKNRDACIREIGWTTLRMYQRSTHSAKLNEQEIKLKDTGWVCR